ncbi:hypothetical protein KKF05_01005 [Patescibacteria group bacterium]|nr:hypothetical protein [Patescibacteria group bacterium]MBU1916181.1 hypothetical protein [Patescibacteria group bacterium]
MDGLLRCTRYAFGPNRLHYCGPDANREVLAYIEAGVSDPGLSALLQKFQTLYPYLCLIARANNIRDPFDDQVVEAYWLGNRLLENVNRYQFYRHLEDDLQLKKKVTPAQLDDITAPLAKNAVPHHSYHVFSVWKRTGHNDVPHTIESLDACRISWGTVTAVAGPKISVLRRPILTIGNQLTLGEPQPITVWRSLDCREDIDDVRLGQIITMHWGVPCEVITLEQKKNLKKYTLQHLVNIVGQM